jgi:hypothetical protein
VCRRHAPGESGNWVLHMPSAKHQRTLLIRKETQVAGNGRAAIPHHYHVHYLIGSGYFWFYELELELIQTHTAQKPLMWVEVGALAVRNLHYRPECGGVVRAGAGVAWRLCVCCL